MTKKNTKKKSRVQKEAVKERLASFILNTKKWAEKTFKAFKKALAEKEVKTLVVLSVIVLILAIIGLILITGSGDQNEQVDSPVADEIKFRDPLTGAPLEEARTKPFVYSVMVENAADAWPLSGVDEAFLVIEAPVEGNIPRFITFFDSEKEVNEIGPVRSARPYYVSWTGWFDSLYAHVGGSPEALEDLRRSRVKDLNEFFNGQYFYRSRLRNAPHNVYTDSELLAKARQSKSWASYSYNHSFSFSEDLNEEYPAADKVFIDWSNGSLYDIAWDFNDEFGWYGRKQSGGEVMKNGSVISTQNIIVIETDISVIDDVGRKRLRTTGVGRALLFRDGKKIEVTWRADDDGLLLEDDFGNEIDLAPGKAWIEVIDDLDRVETSE